MTVGELNQRMDAEEWQLWYEYSQLEPFGALVDDIRFGTLAAMYINSHRKEGTAAIDALDVWTWRLVEKSDEFLRNMVASKTLKKGKVNG